MRILYITERYPPTVGGMSESCARQTRGLRARDVPLDVLAFEETTGTIRVSAVSRDGGTDYHVRHPRAPALAAQRAWRLVTQHHRESPYSAVVGFGACWPGAVATTFAAWLGVRCVVLVRGNDFDRDWFDPRRGPLVRDALSRADAVGTVSPEAARRVRALFPSCNACWLPNGVDSSAWEALAADLERSREIRAELAKDGRRVVGLFGELKYKKGIPFWLGAVRDAGLLPRLSLLVVGRIDEETRQLLEDPALAPPCRQLSFQPREHLPGLYAACDIVAVPSFFDGMPNVLLETMAAGVVPLVSDAGAMGDVVSDGETGFVFPTGDRDAAAAATARALDLGEAELAAMGGRARDFAGERFSVQREAAALAQLVGAS